MENNPGRKGPRPAARRRTGPSLSAAREALLQRLREEPEAVTLAALSRTSGLHANTVREHLDALERGGLVRKHRSAPNGRGRPAWLYEAQPSPAEPGGEYAGLAATLAAAIHRSSRRPWEDAVAAGTDWGRELARNRPAERRGGPAARREVVGLLDDLGFAPEPDARESRVMLTRCPLLDAANRYPDVVCGVHLGIVRGALEEYDGDAEPVELQPFSDVGACRLHLTAARTQRR
ncbi:MAG TPA: helix-turn-helix domain-containing protein [Nocardioidaceae bacterium]|nr:helix-turn-helix domain-containing protein [Nocardioidaceae bacterium]